MIGKDTTIQAEAQSELFHNLRRSSAKTDKV